MFTTARDVACLVTGWMLVPLAGCGPNGIFACQSDPNDPFQDTWQERSSISCADDSESPGVIGEVIFCRQQFAVTWVPFELRVDYWGYYNLDPQTNELTMTVQGGYMPDDADLTGTVEYQDDGSILLRDMYLGTSYLVDEQDNGDMEPVCGHVLE